MPVRQRARVPLIRVAIAQLSDIEIKGGKLSVKSGTTVLGGTKFKTSYPAMWIDRREITVTPVEIESIDGILELNGKPYRGEFILYKKEDDFLVVNELNIEDYIKGVVPCELHTDELEALKAQAVASRSFAMEKMTNQTVDGKVFGGTEGKRDDKEYDLTATQKDQVYEGKSRETPISTRAVNETHGVVCTYDGAIIQARYSSTCGGRTQDGNLPYLRSVQCKFCRDSPHYEWEAVYQRDKFFKLIGKEPPQQLKALRINRIGNSRRIKDVKFITNFGNYSIKGDDLRELLGLKSTFFSIKVRNNSIIITGKGFGHGIGMCQWGAIGTAEKGFDYKSILKYYYKSIRIEKIY